MLEDSNETALIGCVQKDMVDFVQSIFDLRTNKSYITLILDFLIAVHPSKNLYLPHLKASVYFVLSPQSRMYASPDHHIHVSSGICLLFVLKYNYLPLIPDFIVFRIRRV